MMEIYKLSLHKNFLAHKTQNFEYPVLWILKYHTRDITTQNMSIEYDNNKRRTFLMFWNSF